MKKKTKRNNKKELYAQIEFEYDCVNGTSFLHVDKFPRIGGISILKTYYDGSVNNEWVTEPFELNLDNSQNIIDFIHFYSNVLRNLNNGVRNANSSCHITFQESKTRQKKLPLSKIVVGEVVRSFYPALFYLSSAGISTRGTEYRRYPYRLSQTMSKSNYPAVLFPETTNTSQVTGKTMPEFHKVEFRIPDTFYTSPKWGLFLIDIYRIIYKYPTQFILSKHQTAFHQSLVNEINNQFQNGEYTRFSILSSTSIEIMMKNLKFLNKRLLKHESEFLFPTTERALKLFSGQSSTMMMLKTNTIIRSSSVNYSDEELNFIGLIKNNSEIEDGDENENEYEGEE